MYHTVVAACRSCNQRRQGKAITEHTPTRLSGISSRTILVDGDWPMTQGRCACVRHVAKAGGVLMYCRSQLAIALPHPPPDQARGFQYSNTAIPPDTKVLVLSHCRSRQVRCTPIQLSEPLPEAEASSLDSSRLCYHHMSPLVLMSWFKAFHRSRLGHTVSLPHI